MKRISLRFFIILTLLISLIPSLVLAERLTSLSDVDMIRLLAHSKDGIITVNLLYKNRAEDKLVFWKGEEITCAYAIYRNIGTILYPEKGEEIISGYKTLTRYNLRFYIDIPEAYLGQDNRTIIECEVDTGYITLYVNNDFRLK